MSRDALDEIGPALLQVAEALTRYGPYDPNQGTTVIRDLIRTESEFYVLFRTLMLRQTWLQNMLAEQNLTIMENPNVPKNSSDRFGLRETDEADQGARAADQPTTSQNVRRAVSRTTSEPMAKPRESRSQEKRNGRDNPSGTSPQYHKAIKTRANSSPRQPSPEAERRPAQPPIRPTAPRQTLMGTTIKPSALGQAAAAAPPTDMPPQMQTMFANFAAEMGKHMMMWMNPTAPTASAAPNAPAPLVAAVPQSAPPPEQPKYRRPGKQERERKQRAAAVRSERVEPPRRFVCPPRAERREYPESDDEAEDGKREAKPGAQAAKSKDPKPTAEEEDDDDVIDLYYDKSIHRWDSDNDDDDSQGRRPPTQEGTQRHRNVYYRK